MLLSYRNGHEAEGPQPPDIASSALNKSGSASNEPRTYRTHASQPIPLEFRRAVKRDAKVRLAVSGPSGSGKTYTLLAIAAAFGGPIALVDTERGSAEKYADLFEFDTLPLDRFSPELVPQLIEVAVRGGYRVLIIDSLSHFWSGTDGELDQVDRVRRRLRDNGFAAWREITPKHDRMIDAMLSAPLHILVGMRVKTEWVIETEERTGKTKVRKVGLQPVMRDGIEYDFDVCGEMDQENTLVVTKSRCPTLSGGLFPKPGRELAEILKEWLASAVPPDEPSSTGVVTTTESNHNDAGNDSTALRPPSAVPQELASIWRRMCNPRGVVKEFERLAKELEQLAGTTGLAEYHRILRQHGVDEPKRFKARQSARLCAKEVFGLIEELRENARASEDQLRFGPASEQVVTADAATEVG